MSYEKRLGVIAIVIENPKEVHGQLNDLISEHGELIVGRMGIPYRERNVSVLSLVVDASEDEINSFNGKLGRLPGVSSRVAIAKR